MKSKLTLQRNPKPLVADVLVVTENNIEEKEIDIISSSSVRELQNAEPRQFLDLIKSGESAESAATAVGKSVNQLVDAIKKRKELAEMVVGWKLSASARREMVRSGLNKIFAEAVSEKDSRTAIDAAKLIGGDSEVGITHQADVNVNINLDAIKETINAIDVDFKFNEE